MSEFLYYLNGKFVAPGEASLALNDLGVVRGYGIFEAWRTYGSVPFRQKEHLQRLFSSASQIDLYMPWSMEELSAISGDISTQWQPRRCHIAYDDRRRIVQLYHAGG